MTSPNEFGDGWADVRDGGGQIIAALAGMAEKPGVTAETYQARDESNGLRTERLQLGSPVSAGRWDNELA
ncbi:hypothetical protein GCM10009764_01930 [Nocardia ninae]|uniref:Uncharacterized protein n=1 Tax=Nocardia ninae NBRC 108245 TaxID=1210091 RepID=A0A511MF17_9NOCA|nr:hypothetical protein NN4_37840 [Nocardia ninae NBRC 108245]